MQIWLVFLVPLALLAGLFAFGLTIPVPEIGRGYVQRVILADPDATLDLPEIQGPQDASRPLVVIDAGHGGHDPGAIGEEYREKTLVLGLAKALRDALLDAGGIRVAMTRDDDHFLALEERVDIARQLGADLFISIHADSAGEKTGVSGASIYTLSDRASSQAAALFAERENNAGRINGVQLDGTDDVVSSILVDLSQRRAMDGADEFADLILREGAGKLAFHPEPHRSAALAVLRAPDIPSVLYEAGFLTNVDEARVLASPAGRANFGEVMAQAIRIYFARQAQL